MEKESARNQTLEQLHERRKQVVRLHKKAIKIMKIVELTGLGCLAHARRKFFDLHAANTNLHSIE